MAHMVIIREGRCEEKSVPYYCKIFWGIQGILNSTMAVKPAKASIFRINLHVILSELLSHCIYCFRNTAVNCSGVDFTKGFKTWHKFSTEIRFMLIPIIVLFIAHKFITGNF